MAQTSLTIAPNGRVLIPADMRAELGLTGGDKIIARMVDGAVILEPIETAIRRAQGMVARYVPAGSGLVDELISERRAAADSE